MPLTINVGLSRKASANFQSCGASVNVNAELDQTLLGRPAELQHQITYLYQQAQIALEHQMQRYPRSSEGSVMPYPGSGSPDAARPAGNGRHLPNGNGHAPSRPSPLSRAQRRAIFAIAEDLGLDAERECHEVRNCTVDELSIKQASQFIDHLRSLQGDQVRPAFIPAGLAFGGAMHVVLERFFQRRLESAMVGTTYLMHVYRRAWAQTGRESDAPIRFTGGESPSGLEDLAQRMITAFLASPVAMSTAEVIAVEEFVRGQLADDLPDIVARVDVIWREASALVLADFKTTRGRWTAGKAVSHGEQLQLYRHLVSGRLAELALPVQLSFVTITKTRTPGMQRFDVPARAGGALRTVQLIRPVWAAMQAGHFYTSPSALNCSACPHRVRCPAHRGSIGPVASSPSTGEETHHAVRSNRQCESDVGGRCRDPAPRHAPRARAPRAGRAGPGGVHDGVAVGDSPEAPAASRPRRTRAAAVPRD